MDTISLMVSVDERYLDRLRTMLFSVCTNNAHESFRVYLLYGGIAPDLLDRFVKDAKSLGFAYEPLLLEDELFAQAPITDRYPREMYFRFMAPLVLPRDCKRVLYLDPDVLVINRLRPLWDLDLEGKAFAAAAHTQKTDLATYANNIRLNTEHPYYNSGVFLMDVEAFRDIFSLDAMRAFVEERRMTLVLPDQDLFNALFGKEIYPLDDMLWNYDARNYSTYLLRSGGNADTDWVMKHTVILHFCGSPKPWDRFYRYRFGILYKHYDHLAQRYMKG